MPPTRLKPPRWSWNRALVETAAKNVWRGTMGSLALWEGAGNKVAHTGQVFIPTTDTSKGLVWEASAYGLALKFSGDTDPRNSYIAHNNFGTYDRISILVVFRYGGAPVAGDLAIIVKDRAAGNDGTQLLINDSGQLLGAVDTGPVVTLTSSVLTVGQWYVAALTYDGSTARLYVDGVDVANAAQTGTVTPSDPETFIGGYDSGATIWDGFNGAIVFVHWWDRALTNAEIRSLSSDPFQLLRPALLETEAAGGSLDQITLAVTSSMATDVAMKRSLFRTLAATTTITPSIAQRYKAIRAISATTVLAPVIARRNKFFIAFAIDMLMVVGSLPAGGGIARAIAEKFHDDALMRFLLDNDAALFTSVEVVGALNQINGTHGIEYWAARKTYLAS